MVLKPGDVYRWPFWGAGVVLANKRMKDYSFYEIGIAKSFVYPTLLILFLPIFSWWFFHHAESRLDRDVLASIEEMLQSRPELAAADRARILEFFQRTPMSEVLRSDDPELREMGNELVTSRTHFEAETKWGKPRLRLQLTGDNEEDRIIPLSKNASEHQEMVAALEKYISRYT